MGAGNLQDSRIDTEAVERETAFWQNRGGLAPIRLFRAALDWKLIAAEVIALLGPRPLRKRISEWPKATECRPRRQPVLIQLRETRTLSGSAWTQLPGLSAFQHPLSFVL